MKAEISHKDDIYGKVSISGSKNSSLACFACSIITNESLILNNIPNILDVNIFIDILDNMGIKIDRDLNKHKVILKRREINPVVINKNVTRIRASYYLIGALFSEFNHFEICYPGGCSFDKRPIDFHLEAIKAMGGNVEVEHNKIIITRNEKKPATITLKKKSVGATINILLAAVKTKGITTIINPSREPEVLDIIKLLNKMGANISFKNNTLFIEGKETLHGTKFKVMNDRIEAGSYMLLGLCCRKSNIIINNIETKYLKEVIRVVRKTGTKVLVYKNQIRIIKKDSIKGINVICKEYPFFPTDLKPILTVALLNANTPSLITDNIYLNRFTEVDQLIKMNGYLYKKENKILIIPSKLIGCNVDSFDLRCSFALVCAGIMASKITTINNYDLIYRGYENIEYKLKALGISLTII